MAEGSVRENVRGGFIFEEGMTKGNEPFLLKGFNEVLISVRDIDKASQFYQTICGWNEIYRGECPIDQLRFWKLPDDTNAVQCLLTNMGVDTGYMRLVSFTGVEQRPIRANSQSWDTGGIYDIDLRATDLKSTYSDLQAAGWSGFSDPMTWQFGKFHVSEVLMKGPDDIVLAIIQRHHPPLEGFPFMRQLSHVFNSSQVVRDMDVAKDFYMNKLGFKIYMEHNLTGSDEASNLFGMPHNLYKSIERKICILHPNGTNEGSVELIQLDGAEGRDLSSHAIPPNLGILMLRFPTSNIAALREHFDKADVPIEQEISTVHIHPYGSCKCLAIRSPDGAWLEFIELSNYNNI